MDSIVPPAAPTALYTNVASPAAKPLSSTSSHPLNGRNGGIGGNRTKYNNKHYNSGNGGGNNGRNSNGDDGCVGSSGQTTAPTSSTGGINAPWPTYGCPRHRHRTMYPGPVPAGQERLQDFVATPGLYASPDPYILYPP
jgi:hypothetical protein